MLLQMDEFYIYVLYFLHFRSKSIMGIKCAKKHVRMQKKCSMRKLNLFSEVYEKSQSRVFRAPANARASTSQSDKRGHRKCRPLVDGVQFHSLIGIVFSLDVRHRNIQNMLERHDENELLT